MTFLRVSYFFCTNVKYKTLVLDAPFLRQVLSLMHPFSDKRFVLGAPFLDTVLSKKTVHELFENTSPRISHPEEQQFPCPDLLASLQVKRRKQRFFYPPQSTLFVSRFSLLWTDRRKRRKKIEFQISHPSHYHLLTLLVMETQAGRKTGLSDNEDWREVQKGKRRSRGNGILEVSA